MNALHYVASDCTHAQSQSGAREEEEESVSPQPAHTCWSPYFTLIFVCVFCTGMLSAAC